MIEANAVKKFIEGVIVTESHRTGMTHFIRN